MRHTILLDNKITDKEFDNWTKEDCAFWEKYAGITPTYGVIRQDYSSYPTYIDSDGDIRPTAAYLQSLNDQVVSKYGEYGTDFIIVAVHETNWRSDTPTTKGIWGTNYSYRFGKQHLQYCRWDKDNSANTFGTMYHERHHALDALVAVEAGLDVRDYLDVELYDREITHGYGAKWDYIRWKENTKSLETMAPFLKLAFAKRLQKHEDFLNAKRKTIIELAKQVIYLLKMKLNQKDGVPKDTA